MATFNRLPIRGTQSGIESFPVPPSFMPIWRDGRLLKRWRYIGAYGPDLMLCVGDARIGPLRQRFWALATPDGRLRGKTALMGSGGLRMSGAEIAVDGPGVRARVTVGQAEPVETLSSHGDSYIWTRKTGGVRVEGLIELDGQPIQFSEFGLIDDTAGYHARETEWRWSAGVGRLGDGRAVGWNLVAGVNDPPSSSERSVWVDGVPHEVGPVIFDAGLEEVGFAEEHQALRFRREAVRERHDDLVVARSDYVQPFGWFSGQLPGAGELAEGFGVMEWHRARW